MTSWRGIGKTCNQILTEAQTNGRSMVLECMSDNSFIIRFKKRDGVETHGVALRYNNEGHVEVRVGPAAVGVRFVPVCRRLDAKDISLPADAEGNVRFILMNQAAIDDCILEFLRFVSNFEKN
jgi:hypothetical protein